MTNFVQNMMNRLGITEREISEGQKDMIVRSKRNESHVVRLTMPPRDLREILIRRHEATRDPIILIRPMLSAEHASNQFIASLLPSDLDQLCNVAIGLFSGVVASGEQLSPETALLLRAE